MQFQKVAAVRKGRDEWLKGLFPILPSRFLSPPDILLLAHKKSSNIINTFTTKNSIAPTNKYLETVNKIYDAFNDDENTNKINNN